jgi:hypothetical protein
MKHLAIFDPKTIHKIFNGEKTVDARFSKNRIAPFGTIAAHDMVLIKESGGEVVGEFEVLRIISYDNLSREQISKIRRDYNKQIKMDSLYWHEKEDAKYGTLIFMENVQPVLIPLHIRKHDRRPWVVLNNSTKS